MKTLTYILLIILTATLLNSALVYAENSNSNGEDKILEIIPPKPGNLPGPSKENLKTTGASRTLTAAVLPKLAVYLIGVVAGVSMLFLIIAGVRFSTAYGNEESVTKAKDQAIYAIVGLIVALLAYTIVRIVTKIQF